MIKRKPRRLHRLYRCLAPVYAPLRPFWTNTLTLRAEWYLNQVILPRILHPGCDLLDLGCGPAPNLLRLERLGLPIQKYIGFDLSADMLAHRPRRRDLQADFTQGSAYDLPFADRSFDVVLSTWMFSHLKQPGAVVKEAMRVLRSEGWCVVVCFSQAPGWQGRLERIIEPLFMMNCVPLNEIRSWPGLTEIQVFMGGCNSIACLRKEIDGGFSKN